MPDPAAQPAVSPAARERAMALAGSFFCAGLGQFVQRKWLAGMVYIVSFLGTMVVFLYAMKGLVSGYFANFNNGRPLLEGDPMKWLIVAVISAAVVVAVWLVSLAHVVHTAKARTKAAGEA